ncbi:class I adenylate-forming enzyme family protein [Shimia thalassica]|uniref:class I adenylate-forming enzyme family protein n=1 Tax=Shimia thalassica TaxID=1715693 RepID=UPI0026E13CD5|nr:class I adenylate-forming enzyme family protein [Shimia thalassica]MDO6523531.1 class I adenylate-forming enzyme family protein [Shimia thalassica]
MDRIHDFVSHAAARKPDGLGVISQDDSQTTWKGLQAASEDARNRLQEIGVKPGDRVVLCFENSIEVLAFMLGTSQLGAASVVVNARLTGPELERIIAHSDPSAIMFSIGSSSAASDHAKVHGALNISGAFGEVALCPRENSQPETDFEDVAVLLYTSGTTGHPKAAMLTHDNLINAAKASADVRGMQEGDVTYLALPLSHIFGLVTILAICFAQGTARLETRFDVKRLYAALQDDVTLLPAVPQMHAHLFHYARANDMPRYSRGLLRYVSSGGAPLDPAWKREAEAFYGLPLQNGYGLTECAAGVCATRNDLGDPDISVGRAMLGSELSLDMTAVGAHPEEGIGEILIGGPQVMKGYFRDAAQTADVLTSEGWFRSGDLGRFDEEGRLHIAGRTKELIIRSGFNVYPVEVEAILTEHPDVIVAGVVGRKMEGNEEVLAFVKTAPESGLTEAVLKDFVHGQLAPYKRPERIIVAHDLPAAPTGKILKAKLIETFAAELDQSSS